MNRVTFVYVHLGSIYPQTLDHFAQDSVKFATNVRVILLTDNPTAATGFNGQIIDVSSELNDLFSLRQKIKFFDIFHSARGYWRNTLLRFFLLAKLPRLTDFDAEELVIHLESDVLFTGCSAILDTLRSSIRRTSVCKLDAFNSIGSIVVSPNVQDLSNTMTSLKTLFDSQGYWLDDMKLLQLGVQKGILGALDPIRIGDDLRLVFDGWPIGQYLFGLDPIHNQGISVGGYESPYLNYNVNKIRWQMICCPYDKDASHEHLCILDGKKSDVVVNLHIHSKRKINVPSLRDDLWSTTLRAANREGFFLLDFINPSMTLHADNGGFLVRSIRYLRRLLDREFRNG